MKGLKKKKGFTLIELLAVIIILGVLSVLIIPKVLTSIDESEKNANITSVKNLVKVAEIKIANNEVTGNIENKTINYTTGENINYLDFSGEKPEKGLLDIQNGQIALAVKIGDNCYIKSYDSEDITYISYDESTCGENATIFAITPPQTITYIVTFNVDGGSTVSEQTIELGYSAAEPTSPTKEGYTFGGWYSDNEFTQLYDFHKSITEDITLYAKWIENVKTTYTVTFNSNEGSSISSQTIEEGETATEPNTPIKEGYTFSGWYTDSGLTQSFNFSTAITSDITLYAKWTESVIYYTVTFNSNGGNSISSQNILSGQTVTRPTNPSKTGYTFGGWYTNSGLTQSFSFSSAITSDITLYAKWTQKTYYVYFNTYGGPEISRQEVSHGGYATQPATPTRQHYTFGGWYADKNLTQTFNFNTSITSTTTIYEKWTLNITTGTTFTFSYEDGTQFTTTYGTTWAQFLSNQYNNEDVGAVTGSYGDGTPLEDKFFIDGTHVYAGDRCEVYVEINNNEPGYSAVKTSDLITPQPYTNYLGPIIAMSCS